MARIGETLFRFAGALLLGASATAIDNPGVLDAPSPRRIPTVPVVVAATDIPNGAIIDRAALVVAQWPAGTQPAGAFANVDSVVNRATRVAISKGDVIVPGRLAAENRDGLWITPGKRVFAIRTKNDVLGLVLQPNNRVDITVVVDDRARNRRISKMVMQDMRVVGIWAPADSPRDPQAVNSIVVGIEVTSEEAETLAIASSQGALQLAFSSDGVRPPAVACGTPNKSLYHDLLNRHCAHVQAPPPVVQAPRAKPDSFSVRVYRGATSADELRFKKDSIRARSVRVVPR